MTVEHQGVCRDSGICGGTSGVVCGTGEVRLVEEGLCDEFAEGVDLNACVAAKMDVVIASVGACQP